MTTALGVSSKTLTVCSRQMPHELSFLQHQVGAISLSQTQSFKMGWCASRMSPKDMARIKASQEIEKALDKQFKLND
jgi:hypothetical protein